jgi:chitin disaccharide deacetylase
MKRLIANADDFGMTAGVNRAILEAHQRGVVTSSTLMAGGVAFHDAVTTAASSNLAVGCHVVLVEGSPVLSAAEIPSLAVAAPSGEARFRRNFGQFIGAALSNQIPPKEIESEATAQIRRVQAAGIAVSHLDTHKHTHVFPEVFRPLLRVAAALGVPAVRNPYEPPEVARFTDILPHAGLWPRWLPVRALRVFAAEFRHRARTEGVATTDGTIGITLTGFINQQWLELLLERLPEGTWELLCHPAYEDAAWHALGPRPGAGEMELRIMTSEATRRCLERCGIELISYRDLVKEAQTAAA